MMEALFVTLGVTAGGLAIFSYGKTRYYEGVLEGLKQGESLCQKHHGTNVSDKKE